MERKMGNLSLADCFVAQNRKRVSFLDGIQAMVNWQRLEKLLKTTLGRTNEIRSGAKAYPALLMFKILLLQQWYGLSDQETEFALLDRISFSRFTGLSLNESVPDHTTICRFRNLLIGKNVLKVLLDEVNNQMGKQGKLVKKGVAVDASIIASAARPRKQVNVDTVACDRDENPEPDSPEVSIPYSRDTEAAWLKKGKEYHYGYKAHTAVDTETGLVITAHATPANYSDTGELKRLVKDSALADRTRVYADKGYTSKANSDMLKKCHCKDGIMNRAYRNRPLTKRQQSRNLLISKYDVDLPPTYRWHSQYPISMHHPLVGSAKRGKASNRGEGGQREYRSKKAKQREAWAC
jgi:IS5 family transposase